MMSSLGALLKAAVLAGLIAGVAVSIFHLTLAEPVIEQAIRLEEQRSRASGASHGEPLVSRAVQKVGLVVGLLLYGAIWGLLFGVAYRLLERHVEAASVAVRGAFVAGLVGWSVALFPFLKYPANPPAVGDPATIADRQALYFGFVALSIAGLALALAVRRIVAPVKAQLGIERLSRPLALGVYMLYLSALYVLMPANPDPVEVPAGLVWTFRGISFAGLALFWAVLAVAFARLARERAHA
ncbi:MAG: CbtA family protein [Candidatus Rokubacteria bacterium]|nr:CbtA family protein [Candidatus Rokubacteria bacterium]